MKPPEEILSEVLRFYSKDIPAEIPNKFVIRAMKEYAREACAEQRHICQTEFDKRSYWDGNDLYLLDRDILNSPLPEGL